ncbi:MAG: hypothetical protein K2R98_24215 [Gemmataceae bacterium]|nr:hypothetical protein [Gemmataceae bacterium]
MAALPAQRLLWIEDSVERNWTEGEKGTLLVAADVLSQRLTPQGDGASRQLFRQRLEDAALMTGRVAHAFDNVLTGIVGFAELTLTQMAANSPPHQYISEVLRAAQQGVQLTQQLHLFSRSSAPGRGPTALAMVAADEEARLAQTAGPRVRVTFEVPSDLPSIALDAELSRQLLGHLLDNAMESLGGEGTIRVSASRHQLADGTRAEWLGNPEPGPCIEIRVSDTGSGISPETRQRLLVEPFFTTKPRHRGLGLPIACRILFTHGGAFRLDPGEGRGTVARALLPEATRRDAQK